MRYTLAIPLALCVTAGAFAPVYTGGRRRSLFTADALPTPQESAQALTDYMAKAHEEKIRAVAAMDEKNKERIGELEAEVSALKAQLEEVNANDSTGAPVASSADGGSYEFPATNKAMSEKIAAYQAFVANYVVKSSMEKVRAVNDAENKIRVSYEEKVAQLTAAGPK